MLPDNRNKKTNKKTEDPHYNDDVCYQILHGPSMLAVKAKIYGVLYKQFSSIAFDETASYWSALKPPNFSAFRWSPHGSLVSIGQNFVTTRVVHLPKRTETSLTRHRKRYNPLALYHSSYWSHWWMDTHFLMYLLKVL